MAIQKIPCGGFSYDDSEIVFENGVIHPIGGGGGGGAMVVEVDEENKTVNYTPREVYNAMLNGVVIPISKEADESGYKNIFEIHINSTNGAVWIGGFRGINLSGFIQGDLETNTWHAIK